LNCLNTLYRTSLLPNSKDSILNSTNISSIKQIFKLIKHVFDRAGQLLDMSEGEIRARCTFTGGVQIGRLPGVVQLDMLAPLDLLDERGLDDAAREQYGL